MCEFKKVLLFIIIASTCLFLNNCSKTVVKDGTIYTVGRTVSEERKFKISLKVYKNPEVDYSLFKKFRIEFKASDQNKSLLDRQLRSLVKENMVKRGFVENIEKPDFVVMGKHQNIFVPDRDPGIVPRTRGSFSGYVGGQRVSGRYRSGDGLVTAMVKAKMAQRYWIHELGLIFYDSTKNQVIWEGNAIGYVRVDDIRETMPDLINALLDNYPEPKTKPAGPSEKPTSAPTVTASSIQAQTVTVTWTFANIRSGAGNDYSVVTTVKSGDKLTVIGESKDWFNVRLENGQEGWISNRVVK